MVRLVKGAKWTYGWVVVDRDRRIRIPPDAWREYGFEAGDRAIFIRGSRTSGGFSLSSPPLLNASVWRGRAGGSVPVREDDDPETPAGGREVGRGRFREGWVVLPEGIDAAPGTRLLTVRGSCLGLGFVAQGRIYEEALKHPELAVFRCGDTGQGEDEV